MKTKLGMLNAIIEVDLDKRSDYKTGQYAYDLLMKIYQKSDTAYVININFDCVTKEEVLALSDALRKIVTEN